MSDICGRRRLAKLAFVNGVSGNLRGFLEESESKAIDSPGDFRLTDPSVFHAAFLEVEGAPAHGDSFHPGFLQSGAARQVMKPKPLNPEWLAQAKGRQAEWLSAYAEHAAREREEPNYDRFLAWQQQQRVTEMMYQQQQQQQQAGGMGTGMAPYGTGMAPQGMGTGMAPYGMAMGGMASGHGGMAAGQGMPAYGGGGQQLVGGGGQQLVGGQGQSY